MAKLVEALSSTNRSRVGTCIPGASGAPTVGAAKEWSIFGTSAQSVRSDMGLPRIGRPGRGRASSCRTFPAVVFTREVRVHPRRQQRIRIDQGDLLTSNVEEPDDER